MLGNSSDYSPATVVAASKFKRFLGKHLKSNGSEDRFQNNNLQNGCLTPINRQRELVKLSKQEPYPGKIELSDKNNESGETSHGDTDDVSHHVVYSVNNSCEMPLKTDENSSHNSLSCSKLTKITKKSHNITGGWI